MADYFIHGKIGDNSAAGTSVNVPWKTIDYALAEYDEGDTLWLKGGYEYIVASPFQMTKSVTIKCWSTDRPSSEPIITWNEAGSHCFEIVPGSGNGASYEFRNIIFKKYDGTAIAAIYIKPVNKLITVKVYSCIFTGNIDSNLDVPLANVRYGIYRADTDAVAIESVVTVWYCAFVGLTKGYWGYEKHKDMNSLKYNIFTNCGNQHKDDNAAVSIHRSVHGVSLSVVCILMTNYFHNCEKNAIYKLWLLDPTVVAFFGTWWGITTNISNYYPSVTAGYRLSAHAWNGAAGVNGWVFPTGWTHTATGNTEHIELVNNSTIAYQDMDEIEDTSEDSKMQDYYDYMIGIHLQVAPSTGYVEFIFADNPQGTGGTSIGKISGTWTSNDDPDVAGTTPDGLAFSRFDHLLAEYRRDPSHRYFVIKPSTTMSCEFYWLGIFQREAYPHPFRDIEALDFRWPVKVTEDINNGISFTGTMNIGPYGFQADTDGKIMSGTEYTVSMINSLVQPFEHRQFAGYDVDWEDEYTSWEDLAGAMEMSGGAWFKRIKYSVYDAFDVGIDEESNYFVLWDDTDSDHSYTDINDKSTVLELSGVANVVAKTTYPKSYIVSYGKIPGWYNLSGKNNSENKYGGQSKKMTAGLHDITIEQGSNFKRTFTWKDSNAAPVNVTGYTAKLNIKGKKSDSSALYSTDQAGHITLGGAAGTIVINVPAATTNALDFNWGVWDIELTDGSSNVTRLLEGKVKLSKQVTTV